jgi:hypothetical protein
MTPSLLLSWKVQQSCSERTSITLIWLKVISRLADISLWPSSGDGMAISALDLRTIRYATSTNRLGFDRSWWNDLYVPAGCMRQKRSSNRHRRPRKQSMKVSGLKDKAVSKSQWDVGRSGLGRVWRLLPKLRQS